ncbi:MAG TPA: WecB/TagA/CpsF family glycosyltransferase [Phycisphaerae bacterium]|nr:WecB/TagA/CpsF family glycosyltransferase [Phycisphaerae bacterium]
MRRQIAGTPIDFLQGDGVLEVILRWRQERRREMICVNNPNAIMLCHHDAKMMQATLKAGLVLPDGVGVIVAACLLGYGRAHRVTGPWLTLNVCQRGRPYGLRHFFYGGADGIAARMADNLKQLYPGLAVAGTHSPPFRALTSDEDLEIISMINSTKPDVVWVGLGAPKQEKWMLDHLGKIDAAAMIGVGAAFDFHSGNVKWAPGWVRRCGLEWAHRLIENPRSHWRRNLHSPLFMLRVMSQAAPRFKFAVSSPYADTTVDEDVCAHT